MVRRVEQTQMNFGQTSIASMRINPKSRDDIPRILSGLQYIYLTESVRQPIFTLLEKQLLPNVDKNVGRPGMDLWKIFVLGVLRLDLNCDYDRLCELANEHKTIRQMLGHSDIFEDFYYELQTVKDNVSLLTSELLEEINQIIVKAGHQLLSKKKKVNCCVGDVIPLFLRHMFIFLQTLDYCLMRCAK
jgi:IS5 family transposase